MKSAKLRERIALLFFLFLAAVTPKAQTIPNTEFPQGVISFTSTRDGNYEVYTIDLESRKETNLTVNPALDYWSSWTPDGRYLLFYSKREGGEDIYRMDVSGEHVVKLTDNSFKDYLPICSPDGTRIVFLSDRDHKANVVYLMNSDGTNVRRLTENEDFEESASWSPDAKSLIFTRALREPEDSTYASNGELFLMDADGRNELRLTFRKGYDSGGVFSPDGKRVAFYGTDETGNFEIYLINADGSGIENLTRDPLEDYSPSWSPDGKWIAYTSGENGIYHVWVINILTREKIRLTNLPRRNETPFWRPEPRG